MTILVDANLLTYAYNRAAAQHKTARDWRETRLAGHEPIGLPTDGDFARFPGLRWENPLAT